MRLLLDSNADILARDKYWMTPLHMAANSNHLACAGNLLCNQYIYTVIVYFQHYVH